MISQGKRFFPGWPVGAEIAGTNGQSGWLGQEINKPDGQGAWTAYGYNFLRYIAPPPDGVTIDSDPTRAFAHFDLDQYSGRIEEIHDIIDANDPDLSAFRKHGGKLSMCYGWADPQLNPMMSVDYYEQVKAKMGNETGDFFRLFMIPGMFHCGGGVGTGTFDAATPVVNWVENGKAPERIEASRVVASKVVRTRPLCPYRRLLATRVRAVLTNRQASLAHNRKYTKQFEPLKNPFAHFVLYVCKGDCHVEEK